MRLVVLYWPPGVGKLTVGGEFATLTRVKLFYNHLTVNLMAVFPPGSEAWNRLSRRIRLEVFDEVAQEGVDLVLTRAPRTANQDEVERVRMMIEPVRVAGGAVLFVQLACDHDELLTRVQKMPGGRRASSPTLRFWSTCSTWTRPCRSSRICGSIRPACHQRRPLRGWRDTSDCRCSNPTSRRSFRKTHA